MCCGLFCPRIEAAINDQAEIWVVLNAALLSQELDGAEREGLRREREGWELLGEAITAWVYRTGHEERPKPLPSSGATRIDEAPRLRLRASDGAPRLRLRASDGALRRARRPVYGRQTAPAKSRRSGQPPRRRSGPRSVLRNGTRTFVTAYQR